jgi:hypothetical protein
VKYRRPTHQLVGDFKNAGREWRPQGDPQQVRVHDFLIQELGRAVPYGVYDLAANAGWVSVGIDHDTAAFAVQAIRSWWHDVGKSRYGDAHRLTITADGGGSNGSRVRLWKRELQALADELGIEITVHHFPPGTSSRVDDWRGGVSLPVGCWQPLSRHPLNPDWRSSVSSRRSSNRTCRSPASGFHLRHQAFALGRSARRRGKA